jgi:hypothetical protein
MRAKLISVKWEYTVYPPNYSPGDGYSDCKSLTEAKSKCKKFGNGSSIMRTRVALYSDKWQCSNNPFPSLWKLLNTGDFKVIQ